MTAPPSTAPPVATTPDTTPGTTPDTATVASRWFAALSQGDIAAAAALLAPDVEFVNYTPEPGFNDVMPWIGTYVGPSAVVASFEVFTGCCEVLSEDLVALLVDGPRAHGVLRERSRVRATGVEFEIEFVQALTVEGGLVTHWKSYTDPSPIIRALTAPATGTRSDPTQETSR